AKFDLNNAMFCATDKGIVKTTETVAFDIQRFEFHLNLYNRFQILQQAQEKVEPSKNTAEPMQEDVDLIRNAADPMEVEDFLSLPKSLKIASKELSQGSELRVLCQAM
ncbi:hypothetical protein, partial, partial [Parasitella parasitica]